MEKLADLADVSPAIISLIENHKSAGSPESLEKLAKALKIEVGELFDVKPEKGGSVMRIFVADEDRDTARRLIEALRDAVKDKP
jgi:transcriptional regulator with XRE-family HTH domain